MLVTLTGDELEWLEANPGQGEALWDMKIARAKAQLAGDTSGGAS